MVTLSFNLAPGVSLGEATKAIQQAEQDIHLPASIHTSFQGTAAAFQNSLVDRAAADSGGARHRLHRAGRAVRKLHSSHHDSLHAALGRRGRDPGAADLTGNDLSVIALIGIILLIGIVKKNAIMMIDFALEAEREEGTSRRRKRSTRPACCASVPS